LISVAKGGKGGYKCKVCGKVFKTEEDLLWHHLGHAENTDVYDD
jgi:tRNA(Ile2) C34 agmatinyltransferase TiaS